MSQELIPWLFSSLKVIKNRKMSASITLQVDFDLSIEYCLLYVSQSISYADIGNSLSFVEIPSSDRD